MAEETHGSRTAAPKGIINTCLASGAVGFVYLITLLFCTVHLEDIINGPTDTATVNVFLYAGGQQFGPALTWLICINLFFAG